MEPHTVGLFSELLQINEKHIKGAEDELQRIRRPRKKAIAIRHIDTGTKESDPDRFSLWSDGKLHIPLLCTHDNVLVEYEAGGDGRTEPRGGWMVWCPDCNNEDMTDSQAEAYLQRDEPDWDLQAKDDI